MSLQFALGDSIFGNFGATSSTYQSGSYLRDRLLLYLGNAGGVDRSALVFVEPKYLHPPEMGVKFQPKKGLFLMKGLKFHTQTEDLHNFCLFVCLFVCLFAI